MSPPGAFDGGIWRRRAWRNRLQSLLLLTAMAGFLAMLGWLLWGAQGLVALLSAGAVAVIANPMLSPWLVMRMYGARPLGRHQAPALWQMVSELAERAGLPARPRLFYVPSGMLNAFAVGSQPQSAIAVTDGLLRQLDTRELMGVLAHEISHVRSNDLWVMGLADLFSRATGLLSLFGQLLLLISLPLMFFSVVSINWFAILLLILAPNLSALAQLALSRTREYDADLNAVRLTGDPEGLAWALDKIERVQGGWMERILLPGRRIPAPSLLRTHPQTAARIARLMELQPRRKRAAHAAERNGRAPGLDHLHEPVRPPRWHLTGLWH